MLLTFIFSLYVYLLLSCIFFFFFLNDTATTEIYTLSLHDALPIYHVSVGGGGVEVRPAAPGATALEEPVPPKSRHIRVDLDRKSTRLNSSHLVISYAVFCLKKKMNLLPLTDQHISVRLCHEGR